MRHWMISAALLISSSMTLAAAATSTTPAPAAPTGPASPAQPAAAAAADTPIKVLVARFAEVNEQQQPDWINRAIQQSVADDLSALASVEVMPNNPAAQLPSTAQAKAAGVTYIVRGTIQRLNGEIRVSGRVQNVEDGKTIGSFKATGSQSQLFAIEDAVTQQLTRAIAPMEGELQDARPVVTGPGGGPITPTLQPGQQSGRGVFEGSDLQRSLEDRDYLRRVQRRAPSDYTEPPIYYPPTPVAYPPTYPGYGGYGYGYGYGYGCGYGWDGGNNNVVIINPGSGGGSVGNGGGIGVGTVHPPIASVQTQRLRNAAVNPGQSGNFIGPAPYRAPITHSNYRRIP